jgi:uncharacterized membrane protein
VLNIRWKFRQWKPALAGVIGATVVVLYALVSIDTAQIFGSPGRVSAAASLSRPVTFADARHVIDRRCAACHSAHPSDLTYGAAPVGVMFDTPEQIVGRAARIRERAVRTRTMPPGNKTRITDEERAILEAWIASGAPGR